MRLLAGLSAACVVAGLARWQADRAPGWLSHVGERLGDASYALYLCHVPTILLLAALLPAGLPSGLVWTIWMAAAIGLALLLAPLDLAIHARLRAAVEATSRRLALGLAIALLAGFATIAADAEIDRAQSEAERAQAQRTLAGPAQPISGAIRAAVDQAARAPDGRWILRGYVIDLDRPEIAAQVAFRQNGRVVTWAERPRLRPDIATALGRPDIAKRRFGFAIVLPEPLDCQGGQPELAAAFDDGRAVSLPREALDAVCPR